jgi:hypothetical protein
MLQQSELAGVASMGTETSDGTIIDGVHSTGSAASASSSTNRHQPLQAAATLSLCHGPFNAGAEDVEGDQRRGSVGAQRFGLFLSSYASGGVGASTTALTKGKCRKM